ncbi:aminoacyl--tRNA ligase-related protein [Photobacterium sp. GJ3]|uniref:aminoacyl--tRNA ligase-related protein n=1 Tax=Photobacterium sp. GJ3 TaxID=2829502 RepID=UPI0020128256|nr:aminoacyl--tRNA ligase-related protein [Photobacterium sp. GJ3]
MFSESIFFGGDQENDQDYALKSMSCPAHILLFKRGVHSYRDMPVKLFEFGLVHRNESSGSLNGCLRLRQFTQDDAHVFCAWSQARDEVRHFLSRAQLVYRQYGYPQLSVKISTQHLAMIQSAGLHVISDQSNSSVARIIKRFHKLKIPNILIIREKEIKNAQVALRRGKQVTAVQRSDLVAMLLEKRIM